MNRRVNKNKTFCSAPWSAVYINPDGLVGPCCIFDLYNGDSYGNLNDTPLEELLNSDSSKKLKLQFLNNEKPNACKVCWRNEDNNLSSFRHSWLDKDQDLIKYFLNKTTETGFYNYTNINYWDIRPNNLCNLGCLICTPFLSSSLTKLYKDLNFEVEGLDKKFIKFNNYTFETTLDYIEKTIKENYKNGIIDHFYFAGGEPLIMPEHKKIIDLLERINFYHVTLRYNTNLTSIVYKDTNWLEIWKKFNTPVCIDASIDGTGDTAMIQRTGSNWNVIKNNLKLLSNNLNYIELTFNMVISILTYPKLVKSLLELEEIFGNKFLKSNLRLTPLHNPTYLCLNSIEDKHIDYSILDKVNDMGYDVLELKTLLKNKKNFLENVNIDELNDKRSKLFNKLYKIKNIDVRNVLPWVILDE
jgi:radical SAM protein with 4Fe4S-binding SPASM domain